MTPAEQGLLLCCCSLGDRVLPLSLSQHQALLSRVRAARRPVFTDREMTAQDLCALGCSKEEAAQILPLLARRDTLAPRLQQWQDEGIFILTQLSPAYPAALRARLHADAPAALFFRGDPAALQSPAISLVGARDLCAPNQRFAEAVGRLAASRGCTLVSGNARGADRAAQEACLQAGGQVLSFVPGPLPPARARVLFAAEDGPFNPFCSRRALARNRLIHSYSSAVFVAQCRDGLGGSWQGAHQNLTRHFSPVYVFDDGTAAVRRLCEQGARPVSIDQLQALM